MVRNTLERPDILPSSSITTPTGFVFRGWQPDCRYSRRVDVGVKRKRRRQCDEGYASPRGSVLWLDWVTCLYCVSYIMCFQWDLETKSILEVERLPRMKTSSCQPHS